MTKIRMELKVLSLKNFQNVWELAISSLRKTKIKVENYIYKSQCSKFKSYFCNFKNKL